MELRNICTAFFLLYAGWKDLRKREIPLFLTALFAGGGLLYSLSAQRQAVDYLIPAGIGLMFLALGFLTGGGMGLGDAWVLLALGTVLDTGEYMATLCAAVFLAAVWAGVLLAAFKKNRKTEIPFVPFLLLGYIGGLIL